MHEITGDRDAVLGLLKDTMRQLSQSAPAAKKGGAKALSVKGAAQEATERDQIVERLKKGYERERNKSAAKALGVQVLNDRAVGGWYAPRDQTIAVFQAAMDEYLNKVVGPPTPPAPKKPGKKGGQALSVGAKKPKAAAAAATVAQFYKTGSKSKTAGKAAAIAEQFSNLDPRWVTVVWEKAKSLLKGKHKFISHKKVTDFRFDMANETTVAIVGDWGGGNAAAQAVAKQINKIAPDHVIHLGDVYYAGTPEEVRERFLKYWPTPTAPGRSFALNSNHEMYSGGYGYFDTTLKTFKQPASYFSLANDHWRFIGLDTGYVEHDMNKEQVDWLLAQFKGKSPKTILLSHHQLFSAFEKADTSNLQSHVQPLLDKQQIYGWIWGHEHLCVVYEEHLGIKAICLGNGCFPYNLPKSQPKVPIKWLDQRAQSDDKDYPGMHTFALLRLKGPNIEMEFIDQDGNSASPLTWS